MLVIGNIRLVYVTLFFLTVMLTGCSENDGTFKEGYHYSVFEKHAPSHSPQIIKFVSFACPACRKTEEALKDYQPDENVKYERIQVRLGRKSWEQLLRAYSTLRVLNIHDKLAEKLFIAIQDEKKYLGDRHSLAIWVNQNIESIPTAVVKNAYVNQKTLEVSEMYKNAEILYEVKSIPEIWVNGNMRVNLKNLGGNSSAEKTAFLHKLLDHLVTLNHKQITSDHR